MAKDHPIAEEAVGLHKRTGRKLEERIGELVSLVHKDQDHRTEWLQRQNRYYLRRYVRHDRHTDWPWPNASDIVMPTIDMTIDRIKASLARVVFTRPMANFEPRHPVAATRMITAREFFDWLLTEGIQGFRRNIHWGLDQMLQVGWNVFKVYWDYRTEKRTHILRREDLPEAFRMFYPRGDELQGNAAAAVGLARNEAEFRSELKLNEPAVRERIQRELNLDPKDETDRKAISDIIQFLLKQRDEVRYRTREVVANNPRVDAVDWQHFIVPSSTHDIQVARRITHEIFLTESEFKQRGHDNRWIKNAVDKVLRVRDDEVMTRQNRHIPSTETDHFKDHREGLNQVDKDQLIKVWEVYTWEDVDGDGQDERVVYTIHPGTQTLLKPIQEIPYKHGKFPFAVIRFEENDPRFYSSRGIPEMLDDIDHEITQRHRAKLNNLDLRVPAFTYRLGSHVNPNTWRFMPGAMFPVTRPDDIQPVQIPNYTPDEEREENILSTWVQRRIGGLDTGLVNTQNLSEARTATEIQAIQRTASEMLAYRGDLVLTGLKDVYDMVWDLWNQWGSKDIYLRVTGKKMQRLTKEQIKGDFDITPRGSIQTSDPQAEAQRAFQRLQVLTDLKRLGPELLGSRFSIDLGEALRLWLQRDNANDAQAVLRERSEQEQQAINQLVAQSQNAENRMATNQPVTLEEAQEILKKVEKDAPQGKRQQISVKA